jgi:hypothetical protein
VSYSIARRFALLLVLFALPVVSRAEVTLRFSARVGGTNNIDVGNIFHEGASANLQGQIITGTATIDSAGLVQECGAGGACYGDFGAGSISVSFTLNGVTSTTVSTGTLGYYGYRSGGSVSIMDPAPGDGGYNNFEIQADSPDGMLQQQIGAMYNLQAAFTAYGGSRAAPDPEVAIDSLATIDDGQLVWGGITLLTPIEHIDAEVIAISVPVPEPAGLGLAGFALAAAVRRWSGAVRRLS